VFAVFTPTMPARVNFVPRDSVNDALVDALQTPGKQIVLYGESGSGKSTLVQKKLEELYEAHITTRCNAASTFDGIVLDAFDQLNQYYVESDKSTASRHFKASLQQDIAGLKAAIEAQDGSAEEVTKKRVVAQPGRRVVRAVDDPGRAPRDHRQGRGADERQDQQPGRRHPPVLQRPRQCLPPSLSQHLPGRWRRGDGS